ncbi:hypothetical protein Leryth_007619 [Lithospermum erythrorhizon]|nr:hypothetical protein Leryth_007619 [Lithospermum erythrorhizon]
MSSTTTSCSSHGMFLATAMAVSGTVILLGFGIQKSTRHHLLVNSLPQPLPRSCLSSDVKEKKKKKVHFAEDVVDPIGNNEEYRRKKHRMITSNIQQYNNSGIEEKESSTLLRKKGGGGRRQELAGNKMALYNGILRDRVHHRVAYSY